MSIRRACVLAGLGLPFVLGVGAASAQNTPPISDPGGPYTVVYGQDWLLDGSGSYDDDPGDTIVSWEWDLNGDSIYGDVEGDMVTLTQSDYDTWLGTLGPIELDIPYGFRLKVTDTMDNTSSAMGSVTFVVPEPATISLLLLGGVALVRRRP